MEGRENKRDKVGLYFNEYTVFDSRLAEILIATKKYLYYKEERLHWKTKKPMECWIFEYVEGIKEDMEIAKKKVFGGNKYEK